MSISSRVGRALRPRPYRSGRLGTRPVLRGGERDAGRADEWAAGDGMREGSILYQRRSGAIERSRRRHATLSTSRHAGPSAYGQGESLAGAAGMADRQSRKYHPGVIEEVLGRVTAGATLAGRPIPRHRPAPQAEAEGFAVHEEHVPAALVLDHE